MDFAHTETDKRIEELEKRLQAEYRQAYKETKAKLEKYLSDFARKDEAKRKLVDEGKLSQAEYKQWRKNQMLTGQRWVSMVDTLARDMNHTNQIAAGIISGKLTDTFILNANYSAYEIENGYRTNFGFTLYNADTVNRLIDENPDLLPKPNPNAKIDVPWNKQKISSVVTQAVLQGMAIPEIAKSMETVVGMNKASATRNARTAMTGAQNAGRQQAYERAAAMGIKVKKEWIATLDGRTRHSHGMADGQQVEINGKFKVGASEMLYPGDFQNGTPEELYNCRCTMATVEPPEILRGEEPRKTYDEWIAEKGGKEFEKYQKAREKAKYDKPLKSKIEEAKTISDVETAFRSQDWFIHGQGSLVGWRSDESLSLDGLDLDSAKYVYRTYEKFFAKFPQMRGKLAAPVSDQKGKTIYADCTMGFGSGAISINKSRFSNYERFRKSISEDVSQNWLATDDAIMHELGHAIDDFLSVNQHLFGVNGKSRSDFVSHKIRPKILKNSKIKLGDIRTEVSEYATKNPHEWFAEVFAEYMSSENPRKCASAFGEWLEEIMKEVK